MGQGGRIGLGVLQLHLSFYGSDEPKLTSS